LELLQKVEASKPGSLGDYLEFIRVNIEPKVTTTFVGDASNLSAQVIVSRMINNLKVPKVDSDVPSSEVKEVASIAE